MPKRRTLRLLLFSLAAAALVLSIRFGFADALETQYAWPASARAAAPGPAAAVPKAPQPEAAPLQPKPIVLSQRVTEYHISVVLEPDDTLTGQQTVTWKNPGRQAVTDLYFHLYPNAFSPGSTFLKESGGKLRSDKMEPGAYGSMELSSLTTEQGETLLPRLHYVQPDDGNKQDRTLATLRLPEAVKPGGSVTLKMSFKVKLPRVFARMGTAGDFVMAGQWFPKVAVYETIGMRGRTAEGWNLHQYHGNSEFYSDFGIYSVRIDVPETYTVAATGFQTKPAAVSKGRKIYQYYADDVHDFGWAASPHFVYYEDSLSAPGIPGVRIRLYLDPLHKDLRDRYMHAAKSSLTKLAAWYGEYPYSTLSVVIPPADGNGAGGMEYPTLVTGAAAKDASPGYDLERTVVHEIAHQYWYGMVASNEFEEAWLDEGFTSYSEDKLMSAIYGVSPNTPVEASYLTAPEPLYRYSWHYGSHDGYADNVYLRAKLVLTALERQVGDKTMNKIMRAYFQKYRFKHPSTGEFQKVVESVTKAKWDDFFAAYVYRGEMADFSIESIDSHKNDQGGYRTLILLKRNGGSPQAVTLLFGYADGSTVRKRWDGTQTHVQLQLDSASPLTYAAVDPGVAVVLDNRRYNNFLKAEVPSKDRVKWTAGIAQALESFFSTFAW
ncbi:M1 family peptidase [Cohnella sp. CFH 77786]|uniref:M1 family metallopeptidase n=1 Tax=Cohnella sp. CFH 77786 TaxID=2662265 RepID=UPI001C610FDA|nr:M1 family metallopeptidase [Cohnella sp. CFH 77786]MBW5448683.1 M1 family peptidase [Cohnella sp. CFH 77786]